MQENSEHGLLPLKPVPFQILLVLLAGEAHGYRIIKEIERSSPEAKPIEPGNLYRSLRTMLAQGLVEESESRPDPKVDDQRRRYFRITALGRQVASAEAERLDAVLQQARAHDLLADPRPAAD